MIKTAICCTVLACIFMPAATYADCDAGYYLDGDVCKTCRGTPYYCPGDDIRYPCPEDDFDWYTAYTDEGYDVISISKNKTVITWASDNEPTTQIYHCYLNKTVVVSIGTFIAEHPFNGKNYWATSKLWYAAAAGYYLSDYHWTSYHDWYYGVKPCTNAPEHAHYTGSGTPDEPRTDGAKDFNDCPWECDDGYGNHNGDCVPLCTFAKRIKTDTGLSFNLYPVAYTSPKLTIQYNNGVCYGILVPGRAKNTINVSYNSEIYHMKN